MINYQATGQLLIATIVAYVAWQNSRTNKAAFHVQKNKLRLDLFERRLKVYDGFVKIVQSLSIVSAFEKKAVPKSLFENLQDFISETKETEFLFGSEILRYKENIIDNCVQLIKDGLKFDKEKGEYIVKTPSDTVLRLLEWFDQQDENMSKLFRKYLNFTRKRPISHVRTHTTICL